MGTLWIVVLGLGTIALGLIMWLAMVRNRKHESPSEIARSEAGTREIYAEEDAEDHRRDVQR
jgi:Flp pilus assembly protein TadB